MLRLFGRRDTDFSLCAQIKVIDWRGIASIRILFAPLIIALVNFILTTMQKF